jgi:hypothetical protein
MTVHWRFLGLGALLRVHCASRIARILQERVMEASGLLERIRRCAVPDGTFEYQGTWLPQEGEMRFAPNRPWLLSERRKGSGVLASSSAGRRRFGWRLSCVLMSSIPSKALREC